MKTLNGNLITLAKRGAFDAIVHGCNCFHTMGAGVARAIRDAFPAAYLADLETPHGSSEKLGLCSYATVKVAGDKELYVVNAYTQYGYGNGNDLDIGALESSLGLVNSMFAGKHVGLPRIGCGLAGGDWNEVRRVIEAQLSECMVTIVEIQTSHG